MRNLKLLLEYDGTDFCGWQWQPKGRSVQGVLQTALTQLLQEEVKVIGSGRTDSGVHALGQVVNFKTDSVLDLKSVRLGLNSYLPDDVVVIKAQEVRADFHARFDAIKRKYHYVIAQRPRAIFRRFSWYCKYPLNLETMRAASHYFLGKHAFTAFCKPNEDETHYLCHVELIKWQETEDAFIFEICANRFLHHMVRILVGTFVDVGRGKLNPDAMKSILVSKDRNRAGSLVPPQGLFLESVYY
ncbi:MAG: tRNA pseudouridine(38-40) synthase TruA [bacterium]